MSWSIDYTSRQQSGWGTTSHDYHDHVSRMERTPTMITDVPHYPSVHKVFNNKYTYEEEEEEKVHHEEHKKKHSPKAQKKVQVSEIVETIEVDRNGNGEVVEETVDMEAGSFIQQRRKGFELCKWKTFKVH